MSPLQDTKDHAARMQPETPEPRRCWTTSDAAYNAYHDEEWGRPVRDEPGLYERLCLEGFQSGLAWITVLRKREASRSGCSSAGRPTL